MPPRSKYRPLTNLQVATIKRILRRDGFLFTKINPTTGLPVVRKYGAWIEIRPNGRMVRLDYDPPDSFNPEGQRPVRSVAKRSKREKGTQ